MSILNTAVIVLTLLHAHSTNYTPRSLTGSVQHVADATAITLTGLRASDLAAALGVLNGTTSASTASDDSGSSVVDTEG